MRTRFDALVRTDYARYGAPLDDELFEHAWECLTGLRAFYGRLRDRQAAMVFTVDG